MKSTYILVFISMLFIQQVSRAATYTWTGSTDTVFTKNSNWSSTTGDTYPGSGDTAVIVTTTNRPVLSSNRNVTKIIMSSGSFDLKGFTFTSTGGALFSGGTINNGSLVVRGTKAEFTGTTFNVTVDAHSDIITLSGSIFNEICIFTTTGMEDSVGDGGCVFNDDVTIVHTGSGHKLLILASQDGDLFNGNLMLLNTGNGQLRIADEDSTAFNGNVELNNMNTGLIYFGCRGGYSELATGKTISVGDSGFVSGELYLSNFTQKGNTAQTLTLTDNSQLFIHEGCVFEGNITLTAPDILCGSSIFNGTTQITKTRTSGNYWSGDNIFNGSTTITYQGTGGGAGDELRLTDTEKNIYYNDVTFESSGNAIVVLQYNGSEFHKNISNNNAAIFFRKGLAQFNGSNEQVLNGSVAYDFEEVIIDKSEQHLTLNTEVNIHGWVEFKNGNIISDTTNLITFQPNSSANGAHNGSFVEGPVKKVGDTEFEFPVGKGNDFMPIGISNPDTVINFLTAEYFDFSFELGNNVDTILSTVSPCNFWRLENNNDSCNVKITLPFKGDICLLDDTSSLRIAYWNDSLWLDMERDSVYGSLDEGYLRSIQTTNSGFFTTASSSAGGSATLIVCGNNNVQSWGNFMCLGDNSITDDWNNHTVWTSSINSNPLPSIQSVSAGGTLNLALNYNGAVFAWGFNNFGQLGNGTTTSSTTPVAVNGGATPNPTLTNIIKISASQYGALALECSGKVLAWGRNNSGQIGNGTTGANVLTPVYVLHPNGTIPLTNVIDISSGVNYSMALLEDGRVLTWGHNSFGQLGINSTAASSLPVYVQTGSGQLNNVRSISAGGALWVNGPNIGQPLCATAYAITNNGNLFAWGSDNFGQLGDGTTGGFVTLPQQITAVSNVVTVEAGFTHVGIVDESNQVLCWGDNQYGQIGNGTSLNVVSTPYNVPFTPFGSPAIKNITTGGYHTVATDISGNIYTWGRNLAGQLGVNFSTSQSSTPIQVANSYCGPLMACDIGVTYCVYDLTLPTGTTYWNTTNSPGTIYGCTGGVFYVEHHLIIPANATLYIDDITLYFGPQGKIIVERGSSTLDGGRLFLSDATLTAIGDNCMWQGIEVHGYKNLIETSNQQGVLELRNVNVDYAHCGIFMGKRSNSLSCSNNFPGFTGGYLLTVEASDFMDNFVGIQYPIGYNNSLLNTFTIENNNFFCTAPMRDPIYQNSRSLYFIDINKRENNSGNAIFQNNFFNTPTNTANATIAIRCNSVGKMTIIENTFNTVDRGIMLLVSNGPAIGNVVDGGNTFDYCNIAIYNLQNLSTTLQSSIIANGVGLVSVGILNDRSQNATISFNQISNQIIGINVLRSAPGNSNLTRVIQNTINNSTISLSSGGNNNLSEWYCNDLFNYNIGWVLWDIAPGGTNNLDSKVQQQGDCSANLPGNTFNVTNANLDIDNQTTTNFNLNYKTSTSPSTQFIPDIVDADVIVDPCNGNTDENAYCAGVQIQREIADLLVQRDSVSDSLLLEHLNAQILDYYLRKYELDSARMFVDTMDLAEVDPILLQIYYALENIDSMRVILDRWQDESDDGIDLVQFYTKMCDMEEDTLSIYDLEQEDLNWIKEISLKDSEAGWLAKGILNTLYGIRLEVTCELSNTCDEMRLQSQEHDSSPQKTIKVKSEMFSYPNPFSDFTTLIIPERDLIHSNLAVSIFDINGKLVSNTNISNANVKIGQYLPSGVYFCKLTADNFQSKYCKIIKMQ